MSQRSAWFVATLLLIVGLAVADSWEQLFPASSPSPRGGGALENVGGQLFYYGGSTSTGGLHDLWTFSGGTWSPVSPSGTPPAASYGAASTVADGKMFLFFGVGPSNAVEPDVAVYDPQANAWSRAPSPAGGPAPGAFGAAITIDNTTYLGPGTGSDLVTPRADFWAYHHDSGTWEQRASLPDALAGEAFFGCGDMIVAAFGKKAQGFNQDAYHYDPISDTWAKQPGATSAFGPSYLPARTGYRNEWLAIGGEHDNIVNNTVLRYDCESGRFFTQSVLPEATGIAAAAIEPTPPPGNTSLTAAPVTAPDGIGVTPAAASPPAKAKVLMFGGFTAGGYSSKTWEYTSNVTVAGPDLAFPAVARVQGAGAFFTSRWDLYNAGAVPMAIELVYTPRADIGGAAQTVSYTLPAGALQEISDPLGAIFGFGGGTAVGSVTLRVTSGSPTDLRAQSVVSAKLSDGREFGQFFPALPTGSAITSGQTAYLATTHDPTHYRVNVGLMALDDGTSISVTPVGPLSTALATARTVALDRGGNTQINDVYSAFALGGHTDVVIKVEVTAGSVLAYASVLDGKGSYAGTSDPTTIGAVRQGASRVTLLELGGIQGINEFSGSASLTNYSATAATVTADFHARGTAGVAATSTIAVPAGATLGYDDIVGDVFGVSGNVGTVVLTPAGGALISATGREFAVYRDAQNAVVGTAGQAMAGLTDDDLLLPGLAYDFIGLRQASSGSATERSHIAIYNPGSASLTATIALFDGATGASEGSITRTVDAGELIQVNNIVSTIDAAQDGAVKRLSVSVNAPAFARVFRVNTTGDPITIEPFHP